MLAARSRRIAIGAYHVGMFSHVMMPSLDKVLYAAHQLAWLVFPGLLTSFKVEQLEQNAAQHVQAVLCSHAAMAAKHGCRN